MATERVVILIVTYNAENWLPVCCPKAEELPEGWSVVVVDNASSDGTLELLRHYPHVRLIAGDKNLGFGRANNQGLRLALEDGADYVFLLNQDAEIPIDGIRTLIAAHKAHPEYLIISPMQLNGPGTAFDSSFARLIRTELGAEYREEDLARAGETDLLPVRQGIAAAWLLPREALETVGGFSPVFYHYGEDEDYVNRVLFHGGKAGISPHAAARHHREQRPRKKSLDSRLIDRFIEMANPAGPAPGKARVLGVCLKPVLRQLVKGRTDMAAFILRSCRELLRGDAPGSVRDTARQKGRSFL